MAYMINPMASGMSAYRHNDGVDRPVHSDRFRRIYQTSSRERYVDDTNGYCCCNIRRIKEFFIYCVDAIVNFFCCWQGTGHSSVEKQQNAMNDQPDELTHADWRSLDSRFKRECQVVDEIHRKCPNPSQIASAFTFCDDVWGFNLDNVLDMHGRGSRSWEVLRESNGWPLLSGSNPFADVIHDAGSEFSVRQLKRAFDNIHRKCPDSYGLNPYLSVLIDYMIRKREWVENRRVVSVTQEGNRIKTVDVDKRPDDRSRSEKENEQRALREEFCEILSNLIGASDTCADQIEDIIEGCFTKYVGLDYQHGEGIDVKGHAQRWMALKLYQWKMRIIEETIEDHQKRNLLSDRAENEMVELKRIIVNQLANVESGSCEYGIAGSELVVPRQAENYQKEVTDQLLADVKEKMTKEYALNHMIDVVGVPWVRQGVTGANDMCLEWVKELSRELRVDELSEFEPNPEDQGGSRALLDEDQEEIIRLKTVNRDRLDDFLGKMGDLEQLDLKPVGVLYILQKLDIIQSVSDYSEKRFEATTLMWA